MEVIIKYISQHIVLLNCVMYSDGGTHFVNMFFVKKLIPRNIYPSHVRTFESRRPIVTLTEQPYFAYTLCAKGIIDLVLQQGAEWKQVEIHILIMLKNTYRTKRIMFWHLLHAANIGSLAQRRFETSFEKAFCKIILADFICLIYILWNSP